MKLILISILFIVSCNQSENAQMLNAELIQQTIKLTNPSSEKMYYIVLTDESIAYTDWRPFIKDFSDFVPANESIEIDAKKTPLMTKFLIYYWYDSDDENGDGVADKTESFTISL